MSKQYFVTGTDTGVGKTLVACMLLAKGNQTGLSTAAIKPVSAGCHLMAGQWCNNDALLLESTISMKLSYSEINPIALSKPIAPHLAAAEVGIQLQADQLHAACQPVLQKNADLTVIEGAGGWLVPLNEHETMADLAKQLAVPIILVVGLRLGCINHALLTMSAIKSMGLPLAGWVANHIDPDMENSRDNVQTLINLLSAPLLAEIPYLPSVGIEKSTKYFMSIINKII